MSGGSRSATESTTNNFQRQVTQDASSNSGIALTGGGDVSLFMSDMGAVEDAFNFAALANEQSLLLASQANNNMAGLALETNNNLAQLTAGAQNNLAGIAQAANSNFAQLTAGAQNNLAGVSMGAFDYAQEITGDSLTMMASAFDKTLEALSEDKKAEYAQQSEVLAGVASASRSETASALDTVTKYMFSAVMLVGGLWALRGLK
jgi:hypothetical protein